MLDLGAKRLRMKIQYLALISLMAGAPAWALDIKGVEIGKVATQAQLTEAFGITFRSYECDMEILRPCHGSTHIEGVPVYVAVHFGRGKTVDHIVVEFLSEYYETLAPAAVAKWGTPTSKGAERMQNSYGAQVQSHLMGWAQPDGSSVGLTQYAADIAHGMLLLKLPDLKPTNDGKM
jgi:hypothetical protein